VIYSLNESPSDKEFGSPKTTMCSVDYSRKSRIAVFTLRSFVVPELGNHLYNDIYDQSPTATLSRHCGPADIADEGAGA
jgi:hypothetical protein